MSIKAFAYVRVSTGKQADAETQENQKKAIKDYAERNALEIVDWFEDLGISGFEENRKGLQTLLDRIMEVDALIVYDIDRLTRNFELGTKVMFRFRDLGKYIYVVRTGEVMDFSKKESQLIHVIKTWTAEQARDQIKQNQKRGIERAKLKNGGRWGPKPKAINWREYDDLKTAGVSNAKIANYFHIHRNTLSKRIEEREAKKTPAKESVS